MALEVRGVCQVGVVYSVRRCGAMCGVCQFCVTYSLVQCCVSGVSGSSGE